MELEVNPLGLSGEKAVSFETTGIMVGGQLIGTKLLEKGVDLGANKAGITISKALVNRIQTKIAKVIPEIILKSSVKQVAKDGTEVVVKDLGEAAATGGTICGTTGAETVGIGCLVGGAITAAMFAFDVFNILMTLFDKTGITYVMDQDSIDEIAKNFKNSMSSAYTKAGLPDYYEDEITFDPSLFVFSVDAITGEITLNNSAYGQTFIKYQDDYMKSIGISNWRNPPTTMYNTLLFISIFIILGLTLFASPWFFIGVPIAVAGWYVASEVRKSHIQDAEDYAMSKLCTEIPSKYGSNLTEWDPKSKSCKLTDKGCTPSESNPLSRYMYTSSGEPMSFDQNDRNFGPFWKYWNVDMYVKKLTTKSPNTPVCSRGNSLLYQWCKYPEKRAPTPTPGLTNQVSFDYNIKNGSETCEVTEAYCKAHGVDYKNQTCYVSKGQKIGEFFASEVLVRRAKVSDQRLKNNIKFIKTIVPGVDLYSFIWSEKAERLYGNKGLDIGFIADKLDKKYITIDSLGYKNINTNINDKNMNMIRSFLSMKQAFLKYF